MGCFTPPDLTGSTGARRDNDSQVWAAWLNVKSGVANGERQQRYARARGTGRILTI
ncbi:hypothetical protein SAMN06298226_0292 [Nitrosovibrio sp. Nv4]|nr:hypothetical protein SAMN06298226_0292 [Nitrosovibrio sp. Nv4]